ncbi:amidohydrolase family protein [Roseobacter sinensis]|uniref:Amidohydrolase family protein n=1 Tax=Roseobacter sinensis TaxID=2931391 RepID=A0ABT3BLU8_9RHOB|nr:amidohydrolase family protein [Roseobacter sp. WL0113]MCV3274389.1 amidohydrolase family protein [Roseobacter sp. WL0113]
MKLDAHQHYWKIDRGDYHWMPDLAVLKRDYGPTDLEPTLARHGIAGTVLVQAAATVAETEYLLGLAEATPSVKAVVGWIDFEDAGQLDVLKRLAGHPKFVGVRPMIQDMPDVGWMLRDEVQWAYQALIELDLTFDALGLPQHLENFHILLTRYPEMRVVIDHLMKPQIHQQMAGTDIFSEWAAGMTRLAEDTGALCKFSAMITEARDGWTPDDLRPFSDHILKVFGPRRVMWGSDWPVVRVLAEYGDWLDVAQALAGGLSDAERAEVFGGTARRFYRLD